MGPDEASVAAEVLAVAANDVRKKVLDRIAECKTAFTKLSQADQLAALESTKEKALGLAYSRHHRVTCPACSAVATLQGDTHGGSMVSHNDGYIVVKQAVAPRTFNCVSCGLKLNGFAELSPAGLGDQYTRTTSYAPEEYYELINPDDRETLERIARDDLGMNHPDDREYDNE